MAESEYVHYERVQAGRNWELSNRRLPRATHSHGRLLGVEELPYNRVAPCAVPHGCLQSLQPPAIRESGQQPGLSECGLQRCEHGGESRVPGQEWMRPLRSTGSNNRIAHADAVISGGFDPEHHTECPGGYCELDIGSQPTIPVLDPVHLLIVLAKTCSFRVPPSLRRAWRDASFSPRPSVARSNGSSRASVV